MDLSPPPYSDSENISHFLGEIHPPPPEHDSWSFVDERLRARQDESGKLPPFLDSFDPSDDFGSFHRPSIHDNQLVRKRTGSGSSGPALTFYRYGPPSSRSQTRIEGERLSISLSIGGPSPTTNHHPFEATAIVRLGYATDDDAFQLPLSNNVKMGRPASWRPEYVPESSILSFVPSFIRRRTTFLTGDKIPILSSGKLDPRMRYQQGHSEVVPYNLREPPSRDSLPSPFAMTPPSSWMRLYHRSLPWHIDITVATSDGITTFDVMEQMHQQLMVPLTEGDVWNEEINEKMRNVIAQGYRRRMCFLYADSSAVRLDFLRNSFIFQGLAKGRNGMWEIKTRDWRD